MPIEEPTLLLQPRLLEEHKEGIEEIVEIIREFAKHGEEMVDREFAKYGEEVVDEEKLQLQRVIMKWDC